MYIPYVFLLKLDPLFLLSYFFYYFFFLRMLLLSFDIVCSNGAEVCESVSVSVAGLVFCAFLEK